MNQEKTGKFISKLRKDKKMTQQELAEKMGVSINAVSKWERGLSFPDVSLYKSLCKELDISIEELINGEKDNSEEAKEKAILSTVKENSNIRKIYNKKTLLLIIFFFLIICIIFIYNESKKPKLDMNSTFYYDLVIDYFRDEEFKKNPDSNKKDFNVFFSYHGFGVERKGTYRYAYMWLYGQSYYLEEENVLAISSGKSMPFKITFKGKDIIKVESPKDGKLYEDSVRELFPSIIADQVLSFNNDKNLNKLYNEAASKKSRYYNYLNLDTSKLNIEDISDGDLIFSISDGKKECIPVLLSIYKNNRFVLYTMYKACKGEICNFMLSYTKYTSGTFNYDIMEIIRHSSDASNIQFNNENLPDYEIFTGNGYNFVTDNDNRHLIDFLKMIDVDLNKCASPDYDY